MNHRDLLEKVLEAIRHADAAAYARLFAEDAVVRHPLAPEPIRGSEAIRSAEQELFDAFSNIEIDVVTLLSSAGGAAVEVVLRATHTGPIELAPGSNIPPTQVRVDLPSVWIFEVGSDGLITEERDYFDTGSFMAQLGVGGA